VKMRSIGGKGVKWDGKSRIATKRYRDNWNNIFKKKKNERKKNEKTKSSV